MKLSGIAAAPGLAVGPVFIYRPRRTAPRRVQEELASERMTFGTVAVGAMVEVPSAALCAAEVVREADFPSIGTNDLTRYVLAVDAGAAHLAPYLWDAGRPAVMELVRLVCGEAAGGTEFSVAPSLVPEIKRFLGEL